jgi:hypothetical protein
MHFSSVPTMYSAKTIMPIWLASLGLRQIGIDNSIPGALMHLKRLALQVGKNRTSDSTG